MLGNIGSVYITTKEKLMMNGYINNYCAMMEKLLLMVREDRATAKNSPFVKSFHEARNFVVTKANAHKLGDIQQKACLEYKKLFI